MGGDEEGVHSFSLLKQRTKMDIIEVICGGVFWIRLAHHCVTKLKVFFLCFADLASQYNLRN